jgi:parallel beta-helix repeat protein
MMAQRLWRVLLGCLLIGISFGWFAGMALATPHSQEKTPEPPNALLLTKKSDEWQILRAIGKLTTPPVEPYTPTADALPFVQQPNGAVQLAEQSYHRYVPVSSAAELTAALTDAQAGDFIHLRDGLYTGNFVIDQAGQADQPIALYGSRQAILAGRGSAAGTALRLQADHWRLLGFTLRNAATGLLFEDANHNLVSALAIEQIGQAAIHLRRASSDNRIEKSWLHHVGLASASLGQGIVIGSAADEGAVHDSKADGSDRNVISGNVFGPQLAAEAVVGHARTTGGRIENNTFLTDESLQAPSWVRLQGNGYQVNGNLGAYAGDAAWQQAVAVSPAVEGWGQYNVITATRAVAREPMIAPPFFIAAPTVATQGVDSFTKSAYLILPERLLPYTLSELTAYFPATFHAFGATTTLVRENLLVGRHATLQITTADTERVRLLSTPERFVSLNGYLSQLTLQGTATQRLTFEAWDVTQAQPDTERTDGRAYILMAGGQMDIDYAGFFDLGYEEGTVSGVSWKSISLDSTTFFGYGNVSHSHFMRNFFGAYTYEALQMRWIGNTFAHNIKYGFDPHDFSDYFLIEANVAYSNGSHGIILSRGCRYNIIRNNESYDNGGHGIMLDDGRVALESDNARHWEAISSDHNVIEGNRVTNNDDGIVLEGGVHNIIQGNTITGPHRYGIRLKDKVMHTTIISNTITNSERFAIFVYNNSANNRIEQNTIAQAQGALSLQDAPTTTFTANVVQEITEVAITLQGNVAGSHISDNHFSRVGQELLDDQNTDAVAQTVANPTGFNQWRSPIPLSLTTVLIGALLLLALLLLVLRIHRGLRRRWRRATRAHSFI